MVKTQWLKDKLREFIAKNVDTLEASDVGNCPHCGVYMRLGENDVWCYNSYSLAEAAFNDTVDSFLMLCPQCGELSVLESQ